MSARCRKKKKRKKVVQKHRVRRRVGVESAKEEERGRNNVADWEGDAVVMKERVFY